MSSERFGKIATFINLLKRRKILTKFKAYWAYAGERAAKTVAQTALATITAAGVIGVLEVDWVQILSVAGLAGVMSLLTSVLQYDRAGE
jgi:hypothetical protein